MQTVALYLCYSIVQCCSGSTFSNFSALETVRLNHVKFHVEPPWDGKVNSNGLCHMTNMAPCLYTVKTLKNLLLWNQRPTTLKLGKKHKLLKYYQNSSNDDY